MKKQRKPESFIKEPVYPGGHSALDEFVRKNLRYPVEAQKNNIHGTVSVKIDIEMDGHVSKAELRKGIGFGCDEEALRVVSLLRFEKIQLRNIRATYHKTLNIRFDPVGEIPDIKNTEQTDIKYNYIENKQEPGTNSYKINI